MNIVKLEDHSTTHSYNSALQRLMKQYNDLDLYAVLGDLDRETASIRSRYFFRPNTCACLIFEARMEAMNRINEIVGRKEL